MSLFLPTVTVDRVTDTTPEMIRKMDTSAITLDVDNTLAAHGSPVSLMGTVEWAHVMRRAGFAVVIVFNNFKGRVAPLVEKCDPPFLCMVVKPLPFAYWRVACSLEVSCSQATAVGDRAPMDVIGASVAGVKSILLRLSDPEASVSSRICRRLEEPIRYKMGWRQAGREKTDRNGKA